MNAASKFGRLIWRGLRGGFRLFRRRPAEIVSGLLALVALLLGYRLWRAGLPEGLSSLLGLLVCLLLFAVILLTRGKIRQWAESRAAESRTVLQKQIAREAMREGADLAEDLLDRGAERAKGALDTLTEEVKSGWDRVADEPAPDPSLRKAARCPSCQSFVRSEAKFCDRCGEPLPRVCPSCRRTSRPEARYCDHCGTAMPR
jgi:hypothetical protein